MSLAGKKIVGVSGGIAADKTPTGASFARLRG